MTEHLVTEFDQALALWVKMYQDIRDLKQQATKDVVDIDEWTTYAPGGQAIYRPQKVWQQPIVVDYILAIFPTASTSVIITLGERQIPIQNIAAGIFTADVRIQLEPEDDRLMTIAPAGVGFFEIMGHGVQRMVDRP
jgi:hypothetical protein